MLLGEKPGQMHMIYELLYIIPTSFSETEIDGVMKNVSGILEKNGAKIEQTENLGKVKLAYPVKTVRHGTYVLVYFSIEDKAVVNKIDTELGFTSEVLRHVLVKRDEGIPAAKPRLVSYQPPLTPEGKRADSTVKERPAKKSAPPAEKITIEELDKKLDEILESDITAKV